MSEHEHNTFTKWKHTAPGRLLWAAVVLAIAYIFASLAIDSGQLWQWGLAILFFVDGIYNLVKFIIRIIYGNKTTKA